MKTDRNIIIRVSCALLSVLLLCASCMPGDDDGSSDGKNQLEADTRIVPRE